MLAYAEDIDSDLSASFAAATISANRCSTLIVRSVRQSGVMSAKL
jgi:hypothetical protein